MQQNYFYESTESAERGRSMINKLFTKKAMAMGMAAVMAVTSVAVFDNTASAAVKNLKKATVTKSITVGKGKKVTIKVTKVPTKGLKKKFTSKNKKVATVTKKGVVTGKKVGKTTVVVKLTYKKKSVTKKVKVAVKNPVKKLTLNQTTATIKVGATTDVKVKSVTPKTASKAVTYKTSNKKIAKVTAKGKVTGVAAGTAKITVTAADGSKKKATCAITVVAAPAATVTTAPAVATTPAASANTSSAPTATNNAPATTDNASASADPTTPSSENPSSEAPSSEAPTVAPTTSAAVTTAPATTAPATTGPATTAPAPTDDPSNPTEPATPAAISVEKEYTYTGAENEYLHLVAVMTNGDLVKYSVKTADVKPGDTLSYYKNTYLADVTAAKVSTEASVTLKKDGMTVDGMNFTVEKTGEKSGKVTVETTSKDIASLTFYDAEADYEKEAKDFNVADIKENGVTLGYEDTEAKVTTKCAISAAQLKAIKKANVATTVAVTGTAVYNKEEVSEVVEITVDPTNGTVAYKGALAKVYAFDEDNSTVGILKLYKDKKLNIFF